MQGPHGVKKIQKSCVCVREIERERARYGGAMCGVYMQVTFYQALRHSTTNPTLKLVFCPNLNHQYS